MIQQELYSDIDYVKNRLQNHALQMNEYKNQGVQYISVNDHVNVLNTIFDFLEKLEDQYITDSEKLMIKDKRINELLDYINTLKTKGEGLDE